MRTPSLITALTVLVLILNGCSGAGNNPTDPTDDFNSMHQGIETPSERVLWGMWNISFDPNELTVTIQPARNLQAHFNITDWLIPPNCNDCIEISVISFDPDTRILEADVTLRNPTHLTGYDVRGILYTDDAGHELLGPYGWTSLWDIPGGESINPFRCFAWSEDNHAFPPDFEDTVPYYVYIPIPPQYNEIRFAVDASWPGNCKEPTSIIPFFYPTPYNIYIEEEAKLYIRVSVTDWQDDVDEVYFSAPEFTGEESTPLVHYEGISWILELTNNESPEYGDYKFTLTATSEGSGDLAMYIVWDVSTRHGWARDFGTPIMSQEQKITTDNSGNAYVAGNFKPVSDFDPTPYEDNRFVEPLGSGVFLTKYSPQGNYEWALTWYTGDVNSLTTDGEGNIYLAGFFDGWGDFDPGEADDFQEGNGFYDAWLMKLDTNGEVIWYTFWGGAGMDEACGVAVDGSDNVYVTGTFQNTVDFDPGPGIDEHTSADDYTDAYLCKFSPEGNFQWVAVWGGGNWDWADDIDVTGTGDIYVLGRFFDTVDFDSGPGIEERTSNGGWDIFLSNFDSDGNFHWVQTWGGEIHDSGAQVALDGTGNICVCGKFSGTIDFDPGVGIDEHTSLGEEDAYLCKFNSSGDYQWTLTWGGPYEDIAAGVDIDATGNIYVGGEFIGTVDLDPGAGIDEHDPIWSPHAFLNKFTPDGEFIWARDWGDAIYGGSFVRCLDIALSSEGNIYATGEYDGIKVDFDPGEGIDYHSSGLGTGCGGQLFICKFPPDGDW